MASAPPLEERDRFIDLLRVVCIVAVVLGHWATTTVVWEPDRVLSVNALSVVPWTRLATWLIQVMPLVFFAGGFANSVSRRRAGSYLTYLDGRLGRLLIPTAAFLAVWLALGLAVEGIDSGSPGQAAGRRGGRPSPLVPGNLRGGGGPGPGHGAAAPPLRPVGSGGPGRGGGGHRPRLHRPGSRRRRRGQLRLPMAVRSSARLRLCRRDPAALGPARGGPHGYRRAGGAGAAHYGGRLPGQCGGSAGPGPLQRPASQPGNGCPDPVAGGPGPAAAAGGREAGWPAPGRGGGCAGCTRWC